MTMPRAMPSFGIDCNIHPVPNGHLAVSGLRGEVALRPAPWGRLNIICKADELP